MCVYQSRSRDFDCYARANDDVLNTSFGFKSHAYVLSPLWNFDCDAGANGDVLDISFGLCKGLSAVSGRLPPVVIQLVRQKKV
jgi:hypothetical protein